MKCGKLPVGVICASTFLLTLMNPSSARAGIIRVDFGRADEPQLQSGWNEWNFSGSSGIISQSHLFAYADATDGTLDATLSTTTSGEGRNYGLSNVIDPGNLSIQDVWADQVFFNNNSSGSMTLTLRDLKSGTYQFTSYHFANNLSDHPITDDEGTASVFVNDADTSLDVTFISGILSNISGGGNPASADLQSFGTLTLAFAVTNDNDDLVIRFDNLTGGDTFGLNGFQLQSTAVPEPSAQQIWTLGVLGLLTAYRRTWGKA